MAAAFVQAAKISVPKLVDPKFKKLSKVIVPSPTSDGAGVSLKRSIGTHKLSELDPFLLLDEFRSDDPKDYEAGFPEHPHRGFETVTIMIQGNFKHQDSKGNTGYLKSGGVQWLTAGRGILHSETPMQADGLMWGFQLWVNLPKKDKMKEPRYQDLSAEQIPNVETDNGTKIRIVAGQVGDVKGAVDGITINPTLLDVCIPKGETYEHPIPDGHTLFLYTLDGNLKVENQIIPQSRLVLFEHAGDAFTVSASDDASTRFLVVSAAPIKEPVARYGPFVMNTHEEIIRTIQDFRMGNF